MGIEYHTINDLVIRTIGSLRRWATGFLADLLEASEAVVES